jgi:hypothetical protein
LVPKPLAELLELQAATTKAEAISEQRASPAASFFMTEGCSLKIESRKGTALRE